MPIQPKHTKKVAYPGYGEMVKVWLFSPPGRRSETLGDLIENYNFELQRGGKHAKEKADAWAKAEAEEVVKNRRTGNVLYCFRVGREVVRIATWVVRIVVWLVFCH